MTAGGQHHRVGQEHGPLAALQVEGQRPEADPVGDQQLGHVLVVDHGDAQFGDLGGQRAEDRPAGPVAGIAGPPPPVGAEEALVQAAVGQARERRPPVGQLQHRRRGLPGHELDHSGVGQEVAFPQRVGVVLLPGVLGVDGAEGGVDPPGGQDRVGVVAASLADDHDLAAGLVGGDRRAQAGSSRPDDQDVGDVAAKRRTRHGLRPRSERSANGRPAEHPTTPACTRRRPHATATAPHVLLQPAPLARVPGGQRSRWAGGITWGGFRGGLEAVGELVERVGHVRDRPDEAGQRPAQQFGHWPSPRSHPVVAWVVLDLGHPECFEHGRHIVAEPTT